MVVRFCNFTDILCYPKQFFRIDIYSFVNIYIIYWTNTLIDKFGGGPVGINTLATAVSENPETLEEVYEPFLIQEGFLVRTPRGREATPLAYAHLGKTKSSSQKGLFE